MSTLLARLQQPGFARSRLLRKIFTFMLFATAALLLLASRTTQESQAWRYAHDVPAGNVLREDDLERIAVPPDFDTALSKDHLLGGITVVDRKAGTLAAEGDVLDPRLQAGNVGEISPNSPGGSLHIVPLKLVDASVAALLVPGDTVTVVTASEDEGPPRVVADGARVIFAASGVDIENNTFRSNQTAVLLQLPADAAREVAAASLSQPLAVVLSGARAQ
ncbi:hypothetical protein [Corynebacterium gerontici]|uniref:SAF domain-containing protein n=1 Tax=Corynebacterium gerontici TaxID=2079234 RepID=A0A3G6IZA9_9CORY|nr:hypothetical protein [Corynebacterium gerontici]AZA11027.1 hypothetical protein CGERO_03540 [Corynebacterium gerontici]